MSIRPQPKLSPGVAKANVAESPATLSNAVANSQPNQRVSLDATALRNILRQMVTIREFEQLGEREFRAGLIRGYYHSYAGQEAVGVGFIDNLDLTRDYIVDHYRDHGHCILAGIDPMAIFAELFGRRDGVSHGKGGSMHMYSPEHHFMGGDGIVGGGIPLATGAGLALRLRKKDGICVCFFGDGAIDTGAFHESLNMSSLWHVPTVFVCINNMYSMGTSLERHSSVAQLVVRAQGYGIQTERVDGQDVWATTELAQRVYRYVRERQRPYFVEVLTYRYQGHGIHDKALNYRSQEEESRWHARDPLKILTDYMVDEKILTMKQYEALRNEVVTELEAKIVAAKASPEPPAEELFTDVMA